MTPRILIFLITMDADNSFYLQFIATEAPTFNLGVWLKLGKIWLTYSKNAHLWVGLDHHTVQTKGEQLYFDVEYAKHSCYFAVCIIAEPAVLKFWTRISFYETRNYCNIFLDNGPLTFFSFRMDPSLDGTNTSGKSIIRSLNCPNLKVYKVTFFKRLFLKTSSFVEKLKTIEVT